MGVRSMNGASELLAPVFPFLSVRLLTLRVRPISRCILVVYGFLGFLVFVCSFCVLLSSVFLLSLFMVLLNG
jgi:hypothetical protein